MGRIIAGHWQLLLLTAAIFALWQTPAVLPLKILFGGPTMLWGGLWLILSLGAVLLCLRFGLGADSNIALRSPAQST